MYISILGVFALIKIILSSKQNFKGIRKVNAIILTNVPGLRGNVGLLAGKADGTGRRPSADRD